MSYLVFARKYRPQKFSEVIGQDHVIRILEKAIQSNRIAHAYLFCGPRGVGKTSCARILAKSLNCVKGPTVDPCGVCPACSEIVKGNSFDVLEIDGASNRGIDEIRGLRENVKFAPGYGKYKIYIIDEVHMLTEPAFNALLKTLEEPPEHVKFVFATTEPNKVPSTILSRCQRFDFKQIPLKVIVEYLTGICKDEKMKIEQDALFAIAKAAQGGLRDALSILDQVSALFEKNIAASDVTSMLGLVETELLFGLVDALAAKECVTVLSLLDEIVDKGKDSRQLLKDLIEHFRHLMIIKIGQTALGRLIDYPDAVKTRFLEQSKLFTLKQIILAIDMLVQAQDTARLTESYRLSLEVVFAKMTYQGESAPAVAAKQTPQASKPRAVSTTLSNNKGQINISGKSDSRNDKPILTSDEETESDPARDMLKASAAEVKSNSPVSAESMDVAMFRRVWDALTRLLSTRKMSVATFLQDGAPVRFSDGMLTIAFGPDGEFHKETLEGSENVKVVEIALEELLHCPIRVQYEMAGKIDKIQADESVQDVMDTFGGKIVGQWHEE